MNCGKISENYSKNSYEAIPNDERFESILQPVLAMIQHKLKGNYLYGEEYLIKFLQQKRTKLEAEDIMDLSKHMSACVAHLYLILVSMILSFSLGFPLAFCLKTCYRKISDPYKYKYWLFTQSVLFTGAMGFLLIGSATSWNIGVNTQRFMERFPKEYSNVIQALNRTDIDYNENCRKLRSAVDYNLAAITSLTRNIYDDIAKILDEKASTEYLSSLEKFDRAVNNLEEVFHSIGFMDIGYNPTSRIANAIDQLHYESTIISQYFLGAFSNSHDETLMTGGLMEDIVFPRNYVYPDWEEFYYDITITLAVLFPNVNTTIRFVDMTKRNFRRIHDKNMESLEQQVQQIQFICTITSEEDQENGRNVKFSLIFIY